MRSLTLALCLSLCLVACDSEETIDVEPTPAADAPIGTASGGAIVAVSDVVPKHFGETFTVEEASIKAKELLADPEAFVSEDPILVEGTVVDVCQKAGCWMVLSDGSQQIRVTMKEHGFAVDTDGTGAWATVQGTLEAVEVPAETVEHLEGESNRPDVMPEKAGMKFQIIATGVELKKNS